MQYRVKWLGYELDPEEWTNHADVDGCVSLGEWRKQQKMPVTVDGIREVQRYHELDESSNSPEF